MQRQILARYHMTNADNWYQRSSLWDVPNDPVAGASGQTKEPPFYLSVKWPGDENPIFSLTSAYVPDKRSNLAAYLAVNADASSPEYGRMRILQMSDTSDRRSRAVVQRHETNETVADRLRPFLNQGAASATFGNLLTLPVGGGLLYVTPVYTQRQGSTVSYPALRFVVVRFVSRSGSATPCSKRSTRSSRGARVGAPRKAEPTGTGRREQADE